MVYCSEQTFLLWWLDFCTRPFGVAAPEGHFLFYGPGVAASEQLFVISIPQRINSVIN